MKNKLLVIGTMAYDAIETPFDKVDRILGGAATYIALATSKFDIDCGLVSVIGDVCGYCFPHDKATNYRPKTIDNLKTHSFFNGFVANHLAGTIDMDVRTKILPYCFKTLLIDSMRFI